MELSRFKLSIVDCAVCVLRVSPKRKIIAVINYIILSY